MRSLRRSLLAASIVVAARPSSAAERSQAPGEDEPPRITLREAVDRALAQNPSARAAAEEIRRSEALAVEARSGALPALNGNGTYTRLDGDRKFGDRVILGKDQLSANLTLTVPLVAPQRWAAWSRASKNVDVARSAAEDARRQLAVAAARAFLGVIARRRVVEADRHAVVTAKAHFDYAHTRFAGGIGNRIDEVRAEQALEASRAELEASRAALSQAREGLGVVVGYDGPLDAAGDLELPSPPAFAVALGEASSRRADVTAARARVDAAERTRKDSYTDYLPFVAGVVQPFYQNPESLTQPKTGWQAQLLLTLPLYDGGLRYGLAAERASLSAEARAQYELLVAGARSDVRVAFEAVARAQSALESAVAAARLAHEAVELATTAYLGGATNNLEVIDAERAAHSADTAVAVAEDKASQARVDLLAASGRFP